MLDNMFKKRNIREDYRFSQLGEEMENTSFPGCIIVNSTTTWNRRITMM